MTTSLAVESQQSHEVLHTIRWQPEGQVVGCDAQLPIIAYHAVDVSVGAFGLPKGKDGEIRLMVARNVKKDNGRWTASAAPAILRNGRLEWLDE